VVQIAHVPTGDPPAGQLPVGDPHVFHVGLAPFVRASKGGAMPISRINYRIL
jgi:hypothetical protein